MLGIEINKTQAAIVAQAIAEYYIKPVDASACADQMHTDDPEGPRPKKTSHPLNR